MEKQLEKTGYKILILITLGAMAQAVYADGYRNPPPTAAGIAKSGAHSVFVDDASAISYNPANLALQDDASIVIGTTFARTENTYINPVTGVPFESDGDWNVLPNLYYSQPIGDNGFTVGLGINTPYGQGISWNPSDFEPFVGPPPGQSPMIPYEASIMLINFNPTVAFKVHEDVYVGVGVDIAYSQMEIKALLAAPVGPPIYAEGDGMGWGVGVNAGVTWLPVEGQRMTLTYRSQMKVDYEGDFEVPEAPPSGFSGDLDASIEFPNIVTVGYGVELSEKVQVEVLVEWLQWSINDTQSMTAGGIPADQVNNWEDTFTFGLGGSWDATDWLIVRGGYAFLPSPIPDETITPLLPDADRHALSFGLGFAFAGHHMIDLAYTYSIYSDRASPITGTTPGTYEIDSNLIGLTYSLSF